MAITKNLNFTSKQLKEFGALLRDYRLRFGLSQLEVATAAFGYHRSHCKVSRIERAVMRKVDAHAIESVASVLGIPLSKLVAIDSMFVARAHVIRHATKLGFWRRDATTVDPSRCLDPKATAMGTI